MTDLIEHAKALALAGDFSPDDLDGDIGTMSLRNPDGPELLSIVQSLSERIAVLEGVAVAAQRFCSDLCEDSPDVPQPELKALHEALDAWEAVQ